MNVKLCTYIILYNEALTSNWRNLKKNTFFSREGIWSFGCYCVKPYWLKLEVTEATELLSIVLFSAFIWNPSHINLRSHYETETCLFVSWYVDVRSEWVWRYTEIMCLFCCCDVPSCQTLDQTLISECPEASPFSHVYSCLLGVWQVFTGYTECL